MNPSKCRRLRGQARSDRQTRPKTERPELRQYSYDPIEDAKANRGELVAAALKRSSLVCQRCGKPLLAAQRATARYCGPTCRSQAWRSG
jgi:hypothetical protein